MPSSYAFSSETRSPSNHRAGTFVKKQTAGLVGQSLASAVLFGWVLWVGSLPGHAPNPVRPQPTRFVFAGEERSLGEWADELARQANVEIDVSQADASRRCRFPRAEMTFWEALEYLAEHTGHRLRLLAQGSRVALSAEARFPVPTSLQGAFRFAVRESRRRLDLLSGDSQTDVIVEAAWEPSFKAYYWQWEADSWSVEGVGGQRLSAEVEGTSRFPIRGNETPELRLRLAQLPRAWSALPRVSGRIRFVGTCQMPQFVFSLDQGETASRQAEIEARWLGVRRQGRWRIAQVELTYPKDMPEFESFQSFLTDHEAYLRRNDGRKFRLDQLDIQEAGESRFRLRYFFREGTNGMAELDRGGLWKFVLRVPGRMIEETVRFELRDVPLP
jgi:hypothetical protein